MSNISATEGISTHETVTLTEFTGDSGHWGTPPTPVTRVARYGILIVIACTYCNATVDLFTMAPAVLNTPLWTTLDQGRRVLWFYYNGMQAFRADNADNIAEAKGRLASTASKKKKFDADEVAIDKKLLDSLKIWGAALRAFQGRLGAADTSGLVFPNSGVLELVVRAKFLKDNDANQAWDLKKWKDSMLKTKVAERVRSCPDEDIYLSGLPDIVFPCMGHLPHLAVGFSAVNFPGIKQLHNDSRTWRSKRFNPNALLKADILSCGNDARAAFDATMDSNIAMKALKNKAKGDPTSLTPLENNSIVQAVHNALNASGRPWVFNHGGEKARSFWARGQTMFEEMSRCWKCRFVVRYDFAEPLLTEELPGQTAFNANNPLSCAEDICNYECSTFLPNTATPIIPLHVILPYP